MVGLMAQMRDVKQNSTKVIMKEHEMIEQLVRKRDKQMEYESVLTKDYLKVKMMDHQEIKKVLTKELKDTMNKFEKVDCCDETHASTIVSSHLY